MFLAMHQISNIPTRSWAFTYHGLSSAVLLGILCEPKQDLEIRGLHGDLIAALSATAAKEQTNPASPAEHILKSDRDIELSGPLSRALTALRNIYDYGTLHGASGVGVGLGVSRSESASGTRTPVGAFPLSLQAQGSMGASGAGGAGTRNTAVVDRITPASTGTKTPHSPWQNCRTGAVTWQTSRRK